MANDILMLYSVLLVAIGMLYKLFNGVDRRSYTRLGWSKSAK